MMNSCHDTGGPAEQVDVQHAARKARQGAWLVTFGAAAAVAVIGLVAWAAFSLVNIAEGNRSLLEYVAEVSSPEAEQAGDEELAQTLMVVLQQESCDDQILMANFTRLFVEAGVLPEGSEASFVCLGSPPIPGTPTTTTVPGG